MAQSSFEELYAGSSARLVRQLYPLTVDVGAAQDLAQEAFARAYARWARDGQLFARSGPRSVVRVETAFGE